MLKVGRQCKLQPKSDYCSKHKKYVPDSETSEVNTITTEAHHSIESSTITDTIMCKYQDSTPMKESVTTPAAIESTQSFDLNDKVADYCSTHSIQVTRRMQTTEKEYCVRMAYMIIRICVNDVHLFLWPNSEQKTTNLVQYINSIGLEAHEIILIDHCRMFMDIDIVLSSKQYRTQLSKFESEDHFTGAIIDAYEQACNLSIRALGYTKELDYVRATRVRPIDSEQTKIGIHIVADAWMPISYAKYIATDMRKQFKCINTDLPEKMLIDGIDTAPYRMRGSLSLPGGIKNGVRLEGDGSDLKYFYISRNDESTPVLDKLDIKITEYQPQDINNEFIKEALQHVESIPDWSDAFDLDASTLKGPNMIVRRVKPSNCSVCGRRHDADSTLRLIFNTNTAFWKCSKAPEGTKAKVWYKSKDVVKQGYGTTGISFDQTFGSKLINDSLSLLLKHMGRSWNEFKDAMNDDSFSPSELSFWVEKHCSIRNCASNDFELSYAYFEGLLKQIVFKGDLHHRFVCYFIHEFLVFGMQSSSCWVRAKVTKYNNVPLKPYQMSELKNVSIQYETVNGKRVIDSKVELFSLLKSIPYRKFSNLCHVWNHDPLDSETFSTALPFQYTDLGRIVQESDLPDLLMHYLKDVLCDGDEESWIWLRSYLANVIHQPDKRTEVMLVLYSQKKRLGKSTLKHIVDLILGEDSNVAKADRLSDVFGERGGTTVANKRVVWFEELTDNKNVFRANMDRMKTSITDKRVTYKPLYQELIETNNTNEYIACTNHLVGVLEDRQTFLHVSDQHANDHAFYSALRANMDQHGCNLFATYLKPYTTQMPMKCHKTSIYKSMLSNASESIETYIKELKSGHRDIEPIAEESFSYLTQDVLYTTDYLGWCDTNNEKRITLTHFKEKFHHYDHSVTYKQCRIKEGGKGVRIYAFCFPINWITPEPADVEA